ncbi:hypothetical protein GLOIN_2v1672638 [Rhizophagus irregularis DAOM 181602=DAOM 197198]|nr:hypothetical protein GLOIN_2v1672638 [Rhizophagus irregularis DAOM 181602=DAOM 197198]
MKNTSNTSLLSLKNGYGTFPESSATIALQKNLSRALECGKKCYRNPISGCTFCKTIPFPTTLVVKNDGSTARDNCSIERNFLSWLRLSVALGFIGISYYFRFDIISPALPSENEKDQYSYSIFREWISTDRAISRIRCRYKLSLKSITLIYLLFKYIADKMNEFKVNYYNNQHNLILIFAYIFTNHAIIIVYQRIFKALFNLIYQLTGLIPKFNHIHKIR